MITRTTKAKYKEILKLDKMLTDGDIPHTLERSWDGWQICYPSCDENCIADAIEFTGSYGARNDELEMMGLLTPEEAKGGETVVGYLKAEDVYKRMAEHYRSRNNG